MNNLSAILKNIKNNLGYFLIIAIYFIFVNFEAKKEKENIRNIDKNEIIRSENSNIDDKEIIMNIPVVPYEQ